MRYSIPDIGEDIRLLTEAIERMAHYNHSTLITSEELNSRLGISEAELVYFEDVEID